MALLDPLRWSVRRVLTRAGYRLTRIPGPQAIPPGALPAQGVDSYGTHFIPLAAAVARTTGPVLELGVGDHSTPLLHLLCHDRLLVSADNNAAWLRRYERFRSRSHELHHVPDWSAFDRIESIRWSVALVDCSPTEARAELIDRLRARATFVVVHDTETDVDSACVFAFDGALNRYRYRSDYRVLRPYTAVVSDERVFELTGADTPAGA